MKNAVLNIIEREGKILFGKRPDKKESIPSTWSLPSDKTKGDESIQDAVERCMGNELGVSVKSIEKFDVFHFNDGKEDKILNFLKVDVEGEPFLNNLEELTDLRWMTFKEFFDMYEDSDIGHGLQYLRKKLKL